MSECVYCDAALDGPTDKGGRPSRFCGEGCKLATEAEMRRLTFLLRKFEEGAGVERLNSGKVSDRRRTVIDDMLDRFDHLAGVPQPAASRS